MIGADTSTTVFTPFWINVGEVAASGRTNASANAASSWTEEVNLLPATQGQHLEGDWYKCRARVDEIRGLMDDWDDAGALEFAPDVIDRAYELIDVLEEEGWSSPTAVVPAPDGTIILAWEDGDGVIEAEVDSSRSVVFIFPDGNQIEAKLGFDSAG